ncbi:MAG: hypothetical protein OXE80_03620 [Gammaproteobacteria bacterium]|nr:hypothetical protein [Gammaproteobacteria bacterium]MCY4181997.1 hypothetical protein [Gammaproteobacteria bacterium]MCY4269247.1 hypothetical protein [Gammaproteobacteria bacterium]MCY4296078.1 hypothetical protein [Gammaproteobacteria bacterium]
MIEQEQQSSRKPGPQKGRVAPNITFVLNWTHMGVFVAVAALGLITLNQGFANIDRRFAEIDRRFAEVNQRFDEVDRRFAEVNQRIDETNQRLDGVILQMSDINARLSVVEHVVGASAAVDGEAPL